MTGGRCSTPEVKVKELGTDRFDLADGRDGRADRLGLVADRVGPIHPIDRTRPTPKTEKP
jgi:hypothetical protein